MGDGVVRVFLEGAGQRDAGGPPVQAKVSPEQPASTAVSWSRSCIPIQYDPVMPSPAIVFASLTS